MLEGLRWPCAQKGEFPFACPSRAQPEICGVGKACNGDREAVNTGSNTTKVCLRVSVRSGGSSVFRMDFWSKYFVTRIARPGIHQVRGGFFQIMSGVLGL